MLIYDKQFIDTLTGDQLKEIGQELLNKVHGDALTVNSVSLCVSPNGNQIIFSIELDNGSLGSITAFDLSQINYMISVGIIKKL